MSFNPPWGGGQGEGRREGDRPVLRRRRRGPLLPTVLVVAGVVVLLVIASRIWVDVLWFQSVGFTEVFTTTLRARALLFVLGGLLVGGAVALSLSLAYRSRPVYAPVSPEQASLDRYREQIEPLRKAATLILPIAMAVQPVMTPGGAPFLAISVSNLATSS